MYLKTMKSGRIKLKSGVIPHIFECQKKRSSASNTVKPRGLAKKENKLQLLRKY